MYTASALAISSGVLVGITYVVVPFVFMVCTSWGAGSLYQISLLRPKDVPIQIRAIAVRNERGWFGEKSTSNIAPMEQMRDRMMILEVVRGEAHTCCHLIEGMM
jgi:hypothetical protein